ncbi:MAG TPA: thioredoxin family protein [Chitinophagaceae bacterium]|nr:thioredoxin family protein [Chitinophagaceae bacterium]
MKSIVFTLVLATLTTTLLRAQPSPPSADEILIEAYQQAAKENKAVFIMFHASWCVWCHRMDDSMKEPALKKYFDDYFVIRHLVVDETDAKKNEENPGANELRLKYHGDGAGIPFWLMLDKNGKLLADSKLRPAGASMDEPGENVGCPAAEDEVNYFIGLLKKFTKLNDLQLEQIRKRFRDNDK